MDGSFILYCKRITRRRTAAAGSVQDKGRFRWMTDDWDLYWDRLINAVTLRGLGTGCSDSYLIER